MVITYKRILCCLVIITIILGTLGLGYKDVSAVCSDGKNNEQNEDGEGLSDEEIQNAFYPEGYSGYLYPVLPGTSMWPYGNHQDMVDICQIPESVLNHMSTAELFQTVLVYPLLSDVYAYDSIDEGIDTIRMTFNGMSELYQREDKADVLLEWLKENKDWFLSKAETGDTVLDSIKNSPRMNLLLLVQSKLLGVGNNGETNSVLNLINGIISDNSDESMNGENREIYPVSLCGFGDYIVLSQQTVYTPRGGAMGGKTYGIYELWIYSNNEIYSIARDDYSVAGKDYLNSQVLTVYGLSPYSGRGATVKYNCHSYAWYSTGTGNTNWIDYFNTSNYTLTTLQSVNVGGIVVYCESYGGNVGPGVERKHSAVVDSKIFHPVQINTVTDLNMISKWGSGGLYLHNFANCPYYYYDSTNYISDRLYYN